MHSVLCSNACKKSCKRCTSFDRRVLTCYCCFNDTNLAFAGSVEEEATRIQQERLTAEEENRTLRETVFESQGRARSAEAALKKVQSEAADRDKQLRIMTDQNAELLRLLEQEEAQTGRLSASNEVRMKWRKVVADIIMI